MFRRSCSTADIKGGVHWFWDRNCDEGPYVTTSSSSQAFYEKLLIPADAPEMLTEEDLCTLLGSLSFLSNSWDLQPREPCWFPDGSDCLLKWPETDLGFGLLKCLWKMCRPDPTRHWALWMESAMNANTELAPVTKLFKCLNPQSDPFLD